MIGFFPKPYDDELAYSVFARYYVYTGYTSYSSVAEDLFVTPKCKPNMELCNPLTNDVVDSIGSMEDFVSNHTMINYYNGFLSPSRQNQVIRHSKLMDIKTLTNILPIPKSKYFRYMRYCPLCLKDDRNRFGETYWHRSHQLYGISVCYKHGCYLVDTLLPITSSASPILVTAEEIIEDNVCETKMAKNIEIELAKYAFDILSIKPCAINDIGAYYSACLNNKYYLSPRGASRNMKAILKDFLSYYRDIDLLGFNELWKLEKVLSGRRGNPYENCLMAMFFNITPKEISVRYIEDNQNHVLNFDEHISELREQRLNYIQISNRLGISYDYCKRLGVGSKTSKKYTSNHNKGGVRVDWRELDIQTLPKVKRLIGTIKSSIERPQRVSTGYVERVLGLKEGQLSHLSICTAYLNNHIVSQEEHWARCIAWAVNQLNRQNKPVHITNIQKLTNIRKKNLLSAIPYLNKYIDTEMVDYVVDLLG